MTLPMAPEMEVEACETAARVATEAEMSPDKVDEIRLAVVEACINALEHSQASDEKLYVTLLVVGMDEPEEVRIVVRDTGVGFVPDEVEAGAASQSGLPRKRGWGLEIIQGLMDEVAIRSSSHGTEVVMTKRI